MSTTDEILAQIDGALDDWSVGPDAMRQGAPQGVAPIASGEAMQRMHTHLVVATQRMTTAFAKVVPILARIGRAVGQARVAHLPYRERRRLGYPHDAHHPRPLAINGREYHRRRRNRR